jgi:hypothetical protein
MIRKPLFASLIISMLAIVGCDRSTPRDTTQPPRLEQKRKAVEERVKAGPVATVSKLAEGDVIELAIPSASSTGRYLDVQRCYVWRDNATKSASMSCPHQPEQVRVDDLDNPGPDIDR